jgi:hypothetical protein
VLGVASQITASIETIHADRNFIRRVPCQGSSARWNAA